MAVYLGESGSFSHMKNLNIDKVFRTIKYFSPISRADISRITNLNKVTVSNVVSELLAKGIIKEEGIVSTDNGRPPIMISLSEDFGLIIGLELSGISTNVLISDLKGNILKTIVKDQIEFSPNETVKLISEIIESVEKEFKTDNGVVAISIAHPYNYNQSLIYDENPPLPKWEGIDANKLFQEKFPKIYIHCFNTPTAAGIGEVSYGAIDNDSYLFYLHGNWNLRMEVIKSGVAFSGHIDFPGHIGNTLFFDEKSGTYKHFDEIVSLKTLAENLKFDKNLTKLEIINKLYELQKSGDKKFDTEFNKMLDYLAMVIYDSVQIFNPDELCCGGYLGTILNNGYIDVLNEKVDSLINKKTDKGRKVFCSKLGLFNACYGCAAYVIDNIVSIIQK